jgi:hypothetical protein
MTTKLTPVVGLEYATVWAFYKVKKSVFSGGIFCKAANLGGLTGVAAGDPRGPQWGSGR